MMRFNAALARRVALILGLSFPTFCNALADGRAVLPPRWMVDAYLSDALVKPSRDDIARAIIPGLGMMPAFLGGVGVIPRPSGTSLLLHFDGSNGSATLTDETGKTVTVVGNTQLTTTSPRFGTACATFDGSGDYFTLPLSSDFQFGTGDWTVAFWVKTTSSDIAYLCSSHGNFATPNGAYAIVYNGSGALTVGIANSVRITGTATGYSSGGWNHVALTCASNSLRLFFNGTQIGSTWENSYNYVSGGSYGLYFGEMSTGGSGFNGQLDELIVVKGTALWTSNFTPPTEPYI